jgi:hypothetical protein
MGEADGFFAKGIAVVLTRHSIVILDREALLPSATFMLPGYKLRYSDRIPVAHAEP